MLFFSLTPKPDSLLCSQLHWLPTSSPRLLSQRLGNNSFLPQPSLCPYLRLNKLTFQMSLESNHIWSIPVATPLGSGYHHLLAKFANLFCCQWSCPHSSLIYTGAVKFFYRTCEIRTLSSLIPSFSSLVWLSWAAQTFLPNCVLLFPCLYSLHLPYWNFFQSFESVMHLLLSSYFYNTCLFFFWK